MYLQVTIQLKVRVGTGDEIRVKVGVWEKEYKPSKDMISGTQNLCMNVKCICLNGKC
jgi:hypothetical protein